jgi:hypothetical protein
MGTGYDQNNQACLGAFGRDPENPDIPAAMVPAGLLLQDMTMAILSVPSVVRRLPLEAVSRRDIAIAIGLACVETVFSKTVRQRTPYNLSTPQLYYKTNRYLSPMLDNDEVVRALASEEYMRHIVASPFNEICMVAGGAYQFLLDSKPRKEAANILRRSTNSLLLIAGIAKNGGTEQAKKHLGSPYARAEHYEMGRDVSGREIVRYNAETRQLLQSLGDPTGGCPARGLRDPSRPSQMLIHKSWKQITDYLLPRAVTLQQNDAEQSHNA